MSGFHINVQQPGSHYLLSTVRIGIHYADGAEGSGTAFFFRYGDPVGTENVYLVTNNHVIEGAETVRLRFHADGTNEPWNFTASGEVQISIANPAKYWVPHPDPDVDLCALPLERLQRDLPETRAIFFTSVAGTDVPSAEEEERFPSIMDILMVGYPNGLWDEKHNLPVQRRGSTATHPSVDFDGRPEVLVDLACFPGSSGSPVVFHDLRYFASATRFLGVLYAGPTFTAEGCIVPVNVPTMARAGVEVVTMMHLGYVIKARKVVELVASIENDG